MAILREVEYDAFSGVTKKWYIDDNGDIICRKEFDERPFIDHATVLRNASLGQTFINNSKMFHEMAILPPIVIEQILAKHGLNILGEMSRADNVKLRRIIETEYPWCKTHEKKLWRPR